MRMLLALAQSNNVGVQPMLKRPGSERTLRDRLASVAAELREKALLMPPGEARDDMLEAARRAETGWHLDDQANSPALQPPK
jgi:hypothetical protein